MLRRRLGRLAKMALRVAHDCAGDTPRLRLVYASRHGELSRSLGLLKELALRQPLSPTAFSLSVHNGAAGIFSILRKDTSPATAIAAGEETFGMALLEAAGLLRAEPAVPVLVIYADEPIPAEYAEFAQPGEFPHALALLLEPNAQREVHCSVTESGDCASLEPRSLEPQSLAFLRGFRSAGEVRWRGARRTWVWH